jgi:hypothetical protein
MWGLAGAASQTTQQHEAMPEISNRVVAMQQQHVKVRLFRLRARLGRGRTHNSKPVNTSTQACQAKALIPVAGASGTATLGCWPPLQWRH